MDPEHTAAWTRWGEARKSQLQPARSPELGAEQGLCPRRPIVAGAQRGVSPGVGAVGAQRCAGAVRAEPESPKLARTREWGEASRVDREGVAGLLLVTAVC